MHIELQHVLKQYQSVHALDGISATFPAGRVVALLGPNGAGKTTLLRVLAGIVAPDSGQVLFDREVFLRHRIDLRRRFMFLPDFPAVFDDWSPLQHVGMTLRLFGADAPGVEERVLSLFREFDLLPLVSAPFATLSRGQRYKAALVAMLSVNPEVWLLDEPFASGMDPHGINLFKRHAREAAARGGTIFYSTQILDAAERFSDQVCVIHRGRIRALEATAELRLRARADASALDDIFRKLREEDVS